jgi:hypothetical protein
MVDYEPTSPGHNSNVTPIGTSLQAYHALLDLVPNHDPDVRGPAPGGIEETRPQSGSDAEVTEAYLTEAAVMARTAFVDALQLGHDNPASQEYLRNRRYVLEAMGALWKYQEARVPQDTADDAMTSGTEAVILPFRRPNS